MQFLSRTCCLSLAVAWVMCANFSHAASFLPVYTTSFDGPNGTQPADWQVLSGATGGTGWRLSSGDYRYDQSGGTGVSHYIGPLDHGAGSATALKDYRITTDFRKGLNSGITGLVGRVQNANNLYHARVANNNQFQLYKFISGNATQLGSTVTLDPTLPTNTTWSMTMTFLGNTISAELFNASDVSVGFISVTDTTFASGSAGLRGQPISIYENFEIAVLVPEPSTFALGGLGLLGLAGYGWRRKRTRDAGPH